MKHSIYYLFGALVLVASCAKVVEKTEESVVPAGKEQVTIIAQTPQTRTTAEVNEGDVDFSWQTGEKIAVVEQDAILDSNEDLEGALFTISNQTDGFFTGTKTAGKDLVFAVSPAQALTEADMSDGTSYTIELPATYSNYVSGTTNAVMIGVPDGDPVENTYKFKFSHAAALIKYVYENVPVGTTGFKFTTDANITGSFDLTETSGVTLTTPSGTNKTSVTIMLPSAISSLDQTLVFYVPVPAGEYGLFRSVLLCGEKKQEQKDNRNEIASTLRKKDLKTNKVSLSKGDVFVTPTITLDNTVDILTYAFTGLATDGNSYTAWSGKNGTTGVVYAGGSAKNQTNTAHNYIQLNNRSTQKDAGIIVTSSNKIAKRVCVTWASTPTTNDSRKVTIYGKSTAYSEVSDLYDSKKRGDEIGSITRSSKSSTTLSTDYEFIGIIVDGTAYFDEIDITWAPGKPDADIAWKNTAGDVATSGEGSIVYGNETTTSGAPSFYNPNGIAISEIEFSSTDEDVAEVSDDGIVTIKAAGETTIKAIFAGNSTYRSATVQYELEVKDNTPRTITAAYGTTPAHGSITFDPASPTTVGTTITVNDEPDEDYVLTALVYNDGSYHDILEGKTFTMPAANVMVTATFSPLYSITHTASNGTISISTSDKVVAGTPVEITALTPESGYALRGTYDVYKTGDTSTKVTVENDSFTMPDYNVTIAAEFDPLYTVSFSSAHGTAVANPASALSGTQIEISVEPNDWYNFTSWTCADVTDFANASAATTTFTMPAKNITVTAGFTPIPHIVVDETAISNVSKDGVTTTKANIYSWAEGFGTGNDNDVSIVQEGNNKGFDGTVVTAATLNGTTLSYTVATNNSGARLGWIKISFKGEVIGTIAVNQAAGTTAPAAGTVLWTDTFGLTDGGTSTSFDEQVLLSVYTTTSDTHTGYSGRSGYQDNTDVTLTASNDNVRVTKSSGTNCTDSHLWFNKSKEATVTTSAIRLYGATSLVLTYDQGTSGSSITAGYSTDGGSTWTDFDASGPAAGVERTFTVQPGTASVSLRFTHPSSNGKNTRFDTPKLAVGN